MAMGGASNPVGYHIICVHSLTYIQSIKKLITMIIRNTVIKGLRTMNTYQTQIQKLNTSGFLVSNTMLQNQFHLCLHLSLSSIRTYFFGTTQSLLCLSDVKITDPGNCLVVPLGPIQSTRPMDGKIAAFRHKW